MTKKARKNTAVDWSPQRIKYELAEVGMSLIDIARKHGLSCSSTLSRALWSSYPASERRIAQALGVPVQEIWPSRYHEDGSPKLRGLRGLKSIRLEKARNNRAAESV